MSFIWCLTWEISKPPPGVSFYTQNQPAAATKSLQSDSVRPHRRQPTRLRHPWDSPGKNTGVGCHFFLQCMKVKVKSLSPVRLLATPMDCSPPGSSAHGIFQARVLEWGAIAFENQPRTFK